MARRNDHSQEQIKAMILQAAEAIVSNNGIESLTVRRLAMDIGYTVGSIYMVYANMQDLQLHMNAHCLESLQQALQAAVLAHETPEQQLHALAKAYYDFAQQHYNRWQLLYRPMPDSEPDALEALHPLLMPLLQLLAPQQTPSQVAMAARSVLSAVHGVCVLSLKPDALVSDLPSPQLTLLVDCFIRGWQQSPV
jgi:AcrR family transcriptional regulator